MTSNRRAGGRRVANDDTAALAKVGIVAAAILMAAVVLVSIALGAPSQPVLETIESANGYGAVTVAFNEEVYPLDGDGEPITDEPLAPDDFELTGAGAATIDDVTMVGDRTTWTVSFSAAVVPHDAVLSAADDAIGNSAGAVAFTEPAPFSPDDLAALTAAVQGTDLLPADITLPLAQEWFTNDRGLPDVLDGLGAIPTGSTEAALVAYLEGLPGIDAITFDGYDAHLSFDAAETASTHTLTGTAQLFEVDETVYDVVLDGSVAGHVTLAGQITYDVDGGTATLGTGADTPTVGLHADGAFSATGRLGIVDVAAQANADLDASLAVAGPTLDDVTISGTAVLDVTQFTVTGSSLAPFTGSPILGLSWPDLGTLVLCEDGSTPPAGGCPGDVHENVDITVDELDALGLRGFTRVSTDDVAGSIGWLAGWMSEVQGHEILGTELPIVGATAGDLTQLRNVLLTDSLGLTERANDAGLAETLGAVSAQQLPSVCGGADTCTGFLTSYDITTDAIEYTLHVDRTFPVFTAQAPTADLGLGDDLQGMSLDPRAGTWVGQATTSFDLTVGILLASDSDLGIGTDDPNIGSRFYAVPGSTATASLSLSGIDLEYEGLLGFLDFDASGHVMANPSVVVTLTDPGDGDLTLVDLAQAGDDGDLAAILSLAPTGTFNAAFDLDNPLVFDAPRTIMVEGPFAALSGGFDDAFVFHDQVDPDWTPVADKINVGHNLGDALNVKEVTAAEARQMVVGVARQMAAMAGDELMSLSVPFVDVRFQEAAGFVADWAELADRVVDRDPRTVSELTQSLRLALAVVGMPDDVTVDVTAEEIAFSFDAGKSITRSYPFSFSGGGLGFAPADGGASMSATAEIVFEPTVGLLFEGATVSDRIFLRGAGPTFELRVDANVFGSVYLGPTQAGIEGTVEIGEDGAPAQLVVSLAGGDPTARLTLAEMTSAFQDDPTGLFEVEYSGAVSARFSVTAGPASGDVEVDGDLSDLGNLEVTHTIDLSQLSLDIDTLVFGTVELSRFIGRVLDTSDIVATDLPLIGDALRSLNAVGGDLEAVADAMDQAWQDADDDPDAFAGAAEGAVMDVLCPVARDCVSVDLLGAGGTVADADGLEIAIALTEQTTDSTLIDAGIDLAPVFDLDMAFEPTLNVGYSLDVVLGLSRTDGFYIRAGGEETDDVLQLFGSFSVTNLNPSATILGIDASVTGGSASLSGTLGPAANAGGFALSAHEPIKLRDLSNRQRSVDDIVSTRFDAQLEAYLPVAFNAEDLLELRFPVDLTVAVADGAPETTLNIGTDVDPIVLDVGSVVAGVVEPVIGALSGFDPANAQFNPLAQDFLREALETEIPVVDESVEEIVGRLAAAFGYESEWEVVLFLIQIGSLDVSNVDGELELGTIEVLPSVAQTDPSTPPASQDDYDGVQQLIDDMAPAGSPPLLRFPILEDPASAVGLLLGGDHGGVVTFAEFAPEKLEFGPRIGFSATLFSLETGIIDGKLKVALEGFFGVILNTGFGYDSSGLRTGVFIDGFYLIDRPGIEAGVAGYVRAKVDGRFAVLGDVASVRFKGAGAVNAEAGLDLFDDAIALPAHSRNDGRLNLHEIRTISESYDGGPLPSELCMFKLKIGLDAHLAFSGKAKVLGVTVFSESFDKTWILVDKEVACTIIEKSGHIDGRQLNLNGGIHADRRFDETADMVEKFEVEPNGANIDVTVKTYSLSDGTLQNTITTTFDPSRFDVIHADLGAGDDELIIHPGVDAPTILRGGPGDDVLVGGDGDDEIYGDAGDNVLKGMGGDDTLRAGDGDNEFWAGTGHDLLLGGGGKNTYVAEDGWGTAEVFDAGLAATLDFRTTAPVVGTSTFYDGTIKSGPSVLKYQVDQVVEILGGDAADDFTVNRYAPDGFRIDGRDGHDVVHVPFSGVDRTIFVTDSGEDATLMGTGTAAGDTVLFRARCDDAPAPSCETDSGPAERGFVALLTPAQSVDRVDYDDTITQVQFDGLGGANQFVLDDVAAPLVVDGGPDTDAFQVGQIFENDRQPTAVADGDEVRTRLTTRGFMSLGVSHETTLNGGDGDDFLQVYSNVAHLTLNGDAGDDTFVLRAFILDSPLNSIGGDGHDTFEYVVNELVSIDGGPGFDTLIVIGTEASDGVIVEAAGIRVCRQFAPELVPEWSPVERLPNPDDPGCAIDAEFTNIESLIGHGLQGNDAFWVRSTSSEFATRLFGGSQGDTFLIGDMGDLMRIDGPVEVDGAEDPNFDITIPDPVVLPGEDGVGAHAPPPPDEPWTDFSDDLVVDGRADTDGATGRMNETQVAGLGMSTGTTIVVEDAADREFPGGVEYIRTDTLRVLLGRGDDGFTVEATHTYPIFEDFLPVGENLTANWVEAGDEDDDIVVQRIDGPTTVETGGGVDIVRAGSMLTLGATHPDRASVLDQVNETLHVQGGPGVDDQAHLILDVSGTVINSPGERVDVEQGLVTQLSMPGQITHNAVDRLEIYLTEGADVANVRGTSAQTVIHGLEADDRYFVSSLADIGLGEPTPAFLDGVLDDVAADVEVQGGDGDNLLMISDRASATPDVGGVMDVGRVAGLSPGEIRYEAEGTFAGGVTVWTGSGGDEISVLGARLDGDNTTLAWEGRADGIEARTVTTLNTRAGDDHVDIALAETHGLFVLNAGDGNDTVDGSASTLGFVVVGGPGNDGVTTGAGDDIVFGDAGRVQYCQGGLPVLAYHGGVADCGGGIVTLLGDEDVANLNDGVARKPARLFSLPVAPGPADGVPYASDPATGDVWPVGFNNRLASGSGDDLVWGGSGADLVQAAAGDNVLVGDHAEVWRFASADRGGPRHVETKDPFIEVDVLTRPLAYVVDLAHLADSGDDVLVGGADSDWVFAGLGQDIANGGAGDDVVWGGDGYDAIWGGKGADRLYGGVSDDAMDVKRAAWQAGLTTPVTDSAWWDLAFAAAPDVDTDDDESTDNGDDILYGGRDRDILQADLGDSGPTPGDRLVDWYGSFNLYLVCDSPYGAGRTLRKADPDVMDVMIELADADGVYDVFDESSTGWNQLALVVDDHVKDNRGKAHPDHPGNRAPC